MQLSNIVVLGSGNVASHLSKALHAQGCCIKQVYSRNFTNAQDLAGKVGASAIDNMKFLYQDADLYLVCLSDSVVATVLKEITFEPKLIAHTAGSLSIKVLKEFENYGVFYPLQSFSKQREIDMEMVPFCIEANSEKAKEQLWSLASLISKNVRTLNSEQRKQCHVAGVLVNNFVNHLYGLGAEVLNVKGIPFEILQPIILETAKKVQELHPNMAQTGPAKRNNMEVIDEHVEMLKPLEMDKVYRLLSDNIIEKNKA